MAGGSSPISSRKMVPPCAASNDPARAATAPVNAPRAWPNSSPSISELASAAQSTMTNGPDARADASWIARATSSLPVPVSPRISTGASLCATRDIWANSSRITVLAPIRPPKRGSGHSSMGAGCFG